MGFAYIPGNDRVAIIDMDNPDPNKYPSIPLGGSGALSVSSNMNGGRVYVVGNNTNQLGVFTEPWLAVLDPTQIPTQPTVVTQSLSIVIEMLGSHHAIRRFDIAAVYSVLVSPDEQYLYIGCDSIVGLQLFNLVLVYDATKLDLLSVVNVTPAGSPFAMIAHPTQFAIYASLWNGNLALLPIPADTGSAPDGFLTLSTASTPKVLNLGQCFGPQGWRSRQQAITSMSLTTLTLLVRQTAHLSQCAKSISGSYSRLIRAPTSSRQSPFL